MADWLKVLGPMLVSALPQADKEEKKDPKATSKTKAEELQASYEKIATNLMRKYDTDPHKGILSEQEMQASPLFGNNKKIVDVFNQGQGMTRLELERLVRTWDTDKNGELTPKEEEGGRQSILDKLTQGADPEKVFAEQEALALKLGAKVSDAKMKELEALFEKHGIPKKDYTPETPETESTEITKPAKDPNSFMEILKTLAPIIPPVIGLFTGKSSA